MLPLVLAAVGGYLVYDSMKSEKFASGGRIKVGTFDESQLRNKEDKKAVEKAMKDTGMKYVDSKIVKKGGKMYLDVFLISDEEYHKSSKFADGGITDVKQGDKVDLSTISESLNRNLELDWNNKDLIELKSRIISGQQKGTYIRTSPDGGEIKFEDGTTFDVFKKDGKIDVLKTSKKSKSKRKVARGQSDEELYEALADMGYDFGEIGSEDFDEEGFSDAAMNLGYRFDEKKKLWFNRDVMAKGGETKGAQELWDTGEIIDFKEYVKDNYAKGGTWSEFFPPNGATRKEIDKAVNMYVYWCRTQKDQWGGGDTFDREIVRDIMLANRGQSRNFEYPKQVNAVLKFNAQLDAAKMRKNKFGDGGMMARGGYVTNLDEVVASSDLKEELKSKMNKGDAIVAFSYTDYSGSFGDKVAIEYFKENHPENIVFEGAAYNGQNAIVFGEVANEFLEETKDYPLGYEDMESFYYEMQNEQEQKDFKFFLSDIKNKYTIKKEALDWLLENKSGYYSIEPNGIDFSYSELENELEEEGLIKKKKM